MQFAGYGVWVDIGTVSYLEILVKIELCNIKQKTDLLTLKCLHLFFFFTYIM